MKNFVGTIFEPLVIVWIVAACFFLFISSHSFRQDGRNILSKTGRSKKVLVRYISKKTSREFPFLIPLFVILPGLIFGLVTQTAHAFLLGAAGGFVFLILLPVMFPTPSTFLAKSQVADH